MAEHQPTAAEEGETQADHSAVLPDARWRALNDRWHAGAKLTAEEFGALLDLALEYHLNARRLLRERDAAEARAERLQELLDEERRMFPVDGVWLVQQTPGCRRLECIHRMADLPDPIPLAAIAMRKEAIAEAVDQVREQIRGTVEQLSDGSLRWTYPAANDVAQAVIDQLYRAGGGEHA
jgi:hypothetical protein